MEAIRRLTSRLAPAWVVFKGTRFYSLETAGGILKLFVFPIGCLLTWHYYAPQLDAPIPKATTYVKGNLVLPACFSIYYGIQGLIDIFTDHRLREARNKLKANQLIASGQADA